MQVLDLDTPPFMPPKRSKRAWWPWLKRFVITSALIITVWCLWIDLTVRRDFNALQWALPARLYASPLELYAGAHLNQTDLTAYLQRLGYRDTPDITGPGEYQVSSTHVRLWTRGFEFWDGREPAVNFNVAFDQDRVRALFTDQSNDLPLVRLEPVEIAQINPDTGEDRLPMSLTQFPPALVNAVVAVEDQRFFSHFGVDPLGIMRALVANLRAGEIVQGGSTLTQQLIKNLYLTRQQTLRRKIEEALMAVSLDLHFSKEQILTAYLNEVFLGQEGNRAIHGFGLAAEYYFARPLAELSLGELALLAGLSQGASYYNPRRYPERALQRRDIVLSSLLAQEFITQPEYEQARTETLNISTRSSRQRRGYPAFMELVGKELAQDYDREALRTEGLRIFTTLDLRAQDTMEARLEDAVKAVERAAASTDAAHLEAAMVITDTITGEVRAIAGGRQRGYAGFNRALQAVRPIGSLAKPMVYLAALESGNYSLASVLSDTPISVPLGGGQQWSPRNYENKIYGDVYFYDALERSMNLATVHLGMRVGVDKVAEVMTRLGYEKTVSLYPSLLLGAIDMTPIEVAQMYQTLASNGFRSPLRAVAAVTSGDGTPLERYGIETSQVVDPTSMYLLEYALQGVFTRGTAEGMMGQLEAQMPLAGKTGTTNDLRDSWFAGYGDDLVGVVWLGYDDNRESGLTGASGALRVWTDVMGSLNIAPRRTQSLPDIVWHDVSATAVTDSRLRECQHLKSLPFKLQHPAESAVNCESSESLLQNILERVRGLGR